MSKIIKREYEVFEFDELSDVAKENAVQKLCDINIDCEWWEFVYENAEQIELKIRAFDLDRSNYCKAEFVNSAEKTAQLILQNHGESCETYQDAVNYFSDLKQIYNLYPDDENEDYDLSRDDAIADLDDAFLKTMQENYRVILNKEYEYLTSKESIIETIKANEYTFLKDGTIFIMK